MPHTHGLVFVSPCPQLCNFVPLWRNRNVRRETCHFRNIVLFFKIFFLINSFHVDACLTSGKVRTRTLSSNVPQMICVPSVEPQCLLVPVRNWPDKQTNNVINLKTQDIPLTPPFPSFKKTTNLLSFFLSQLQQAQVHRRQRDGEPGGRCLLLGPFPSSWQQLPVQRLAQ